MATKETPDEGDEKYAYETTPDGVVMRRHLTLETIPVEDLDKLLSFARKVNAQRDSGAPPTRRAPGQTWRTQLRGEMRRRKTLSAQERRKKAEEYQAMLAEAWSEAAAQNDEAEPVTD